jgi:diguanylate cyclase (GGDEF)-like protein
MTKILLVEDNSDDALLVQEMLAEVGSAKFSITRVSRLGDAQRRLQDERFDVVLLDLSLPDARGLETLKHMQATTPSAPIVVLTGHRDDTVALEAVQHGAQDYLIKGHADGDAVARSIRYAIERKRAQEHLAYLAQYDHLTGLANRTLFCDRVSQALARSRRAETPLALLFLDLDQFKAINDTLGHDVGDLLLQAVADRIRRSVREVDTAARMGGDEFTVLLESVPSARDAAAVAQKILAAIAQPVTLNGHELSITASMGLTIFPDDGATIRDLLKHGDTAMYRAKRHGGDGYRFYTPSMSVEALERLRLESDLQRALAGDEFVLHYQPQEDLAGGVAGMEALLRWRRAGHGLVQPAAFLPFAEEEGLIVPIGEWAIRAACEQRRRWQESGQAPLRVAVNLSARQLLQKDLAGVVARILADTGLDPAMLELELPEHALLGDARGSLAALMELKRLGLRLSIDDFGTGCSALRSLKTLPVDVLKIDQSFVHGVSANPHDEAIITAIIGLAHGLGIKVIAEGVETARQRDFLRDRGCDAIQGFLLCPPLPPDLALDWARREAPGRVSGTLLKGA